MHAACNHRMQARALHVCVARFLALTTRMPEHVTLLSTLNINDGAEGGLHVRSTACKCLEEKTVQAPPSHRASAACRCAHGTLHRKEGGLSRQAHANLLPLNYTLHAAAAHSLNRTSMCMHQFIFQPAMFLKLS